MQKKDLVSVIILGEIIALFVFFILLSAGYGAWSLLVLFVILPGLGLLGFYISQLIGKKFAIVPQFVKYALVGFANTAVDFGVLNLLAWIIGKYEGGIVGVINIISFAVAVIHSYFWNKFWTFEGKKKNNATIQFVQFIIVSIVGMLINTVIVYAMSTLIQPMCNLGPQAWLNVVKVVATVLSLVWNFIGYKLIVFKEVKEIKNGEQPSNLS